MDNNVSRVARVITRVSTYLPLIPTVPLLIITTFNSDILKYVPLELMVAICALSMLLIGVHLEIRIASATDEFKELSRRIQGLESVQQSYLKALTPPLQVKTLAQAFDEVSSRQRNWSRLRIFAISTHQIVTFFNSHQLSVQRCEILIYESPTQRDRRNSAPNVNHAAYPVEVWRSLSKEGRVGTLAIRSYDFLPTEYECIFDDEMLLLGLYESDPDDYQQIRVGSVTMVENCTMGGRQMIDNYQSRFDKLFNEAYSA